MNSSELDAAASAHVVKLSGDRLAELLAVISESRDFSSAARFLVAQFADAVGASRATIMALDSGDDTLRIVGSVGLDRSDTVRDSIPLDDLAHPLVVSTLALSPIVATGCDPARVGLPFQNWIAIPFPQPQFRGSRGLLPTSVIAGIDMPGCVIRQAGAGGSRRRIGHAPGGVIVIESVVSDAVLEVLDHAAILAGPVLSRMFAVEEYRLSVEQVEQQHSLLTAILNSLPDPILIFSSGNDIVVQNHRAEHLLASREGDSEGRRRAVEINDLLFSSHLAKTANAGLETGRSRELNLVDPDVGADLLFEVLTHELKGEEPGESSRVAVLRDVTDLRHAAGELERQVRRVRLAEIDAKRERDRLNLILANVADPILVTDDRSNIILMNRQAEQLFEANGRGGNDGDGAVRANNTKFTTFISDFTNGSAESRREQMSLVVPGSDVEVPVEIVSGKILHKRGEPLVIVSVVHDLTEQVENERLYEELKKFSGELEERIREATADLAEQNARLQWQSSEIEKANRLKSEFLASMSHELRTPINALIGYTALMLDRIYGDITDRQEDGLTRIQNAAHHLLALINDILDLARIEAGRMPLHLEVVSLREIMAEVTQHMEPLLKQKSLSFRSELPESNTEMFTDRTKLKQILLNLLSNAVKFTHTGSVIIQASVVDASIRFEVTDTGIGIRAHDLEAIWEDFRQVDQSRTREFGGSGLGLSITRKLVEALGGRVALSSTFGKGSKFSVVLPLRSELRPDDTGIGPLEPRTVVDR